MSLIVSWTYPLLGVLLGVWILTLGRHIPSSRAGRHALLYALGAGMLLSAATVLSIGPELRVMNDEANLASVARSFAVDHKPLLVVDARRDEPGGELVPTASGLDKRPFLFPYLAGLLHTAAGYRVENIYILNAILLGILLAVGFAVFRSRFGALAAWVFILLAAAQPVLTLTAASGAFDVLHALLLAVCLVLTFRYLRTPSEGTFRLLWLHWILLAHTRYEAFVFVLIMAGGIFLAKKWCWSFFTKSWIYPVSLLGLLPAVWQRIYFWDKISQPAPPPGMAEFSLQAFIINNRLFLEGLLKADRYYPFANLLFIVAVPAVVWLGFQFLRPGSPWKEAATRQIVWIAGACSVVQWVIVTAWWSSPITNQAAARFYIWPALGASLASAWLLTRVMRTVPGKAAGVLAAGIIFAFYHASAMDNRYWSGRTGYTRSYHIVRDFLKTQDPQKCLVIAPSSKRYIVHGFAATRPHRAKRDARDILDRYERRVYEDIFVVQYMDRAGKPLGRDYDVGSAFKLKTVHEAQRSSHSRLRISRVVNPR